MIKELLLYFALLLWFVVPLQAQPTIFASDLTVDKDGIAEVDVIVRDFNPLIGLQFAIEWDNTVLDFVTIHDTSFPPTSNFLFNISSSGKLRIQWYGDAFETSNNQTLFTIRFLAIGNPNDYTSIHFTEDTNMGGTSFVIEFLGSDSKLIEPELEDGSVTITGTMTNTDIATSNVALFQNSPNPFHDYTQITFELKETETIQFSIFDTLGKEVFTRTAKYSTGQHHMKIENKDLPSSGIYVYKIRAAQNGLSKKLIFSK